MEYLNQLAKVFSENAHPEIAAQQKKYMKERYAYFGLKSPLRKTLTQSFLDKKHLPEKPEAFLIAKALWMKPEREFQYFAMELLEKYTKKPDREDIVLYEWLLIHKSWWDTVDFIAANLVGSYFKNFPSEIKKINQKWMASEHIWLQRSCLIFQLKYKEGTDAILLANNINQLLGGKEFFINKAIGWALRQYARHQPVWVMSFVENTPELSGLSKREALKRIS